MSLLSNIHDQTIQVAAGLMEHIQLAAQADAHHLQVRSLDNLQLMFLYNLDRSVQLAFTLEINPQHVLEVSVVTALLREILAKVELKLVECKYKTRMVDGSKSRFPQVATKAADFTEQYEIICTGTFKVDTPTVLPDDQRDFSWSEIEDITGYAIYEVAAVPDTMKHKGDTWSVISSNAGEQTSRFIKVPF